MATETKAYHDVTIALSYDEDSIMEASIVDEDNNDPSCYIPGIDYYVRLYRSNPDLSIVARANFGSIVLDTAEVIEAISPNEIITFGGDDAGSVEKMIFGNFQYSFDGLVFNEDMEECIPIISYTEGSKAIRTNRKIFGIASISYYTKYILFKFRLSRTGNLILSFSGE